MFFAVVLNDIKKILSNYGFYVCIVFTVLLCMCSSVYFDSTSNDDYSAFRILTDCDMNFMLSDISMCSYNVSVQGCGNWLSMFIPVVSAFTFVPVVCDEYNYSAVRFSIFRTSKIKYYTSKFMTGCISGGMAVLTGYIIYIIIIYALFPDISQYAVDKRELFEKGLLFSYPKFQSMGYGYLLTVKCTEVFLYGIFSSVPAVMFTGLMKNRYLVMCIPFLMKYMVTQTCAKINLNTILDSESMNTRIIYISNIINPDSVVRMRLYPDYNYWIMIYNSGLLCVAFMIYLIVVLKRLDSGE